MVGREKKDAFKHSHLNIARFYQNRPMHRNLLGVNNSGSGIPAQRIITTLPVFTALGFSSISFNLFCTSLEGEIPCQNSSLVGMALKEKPLIGLPVVLLTIRCEP